ncbi:glycine zipper 2TM domain-containing protein [Sulfurirhabdus autotrophica]|uniref:Uncharacterized protein YcfJ n=1 Tax=Sulfurirhabdus autotrophica TaxID=1706046 RepID=A0A4R3XYK5_9PROT|nr:glycine zipper 2TM domain-containing protein [Sulfurirhabdus autotrophica]TCV82904.1 uncharacterized protein YcfJ [Sulfurirhabdus autotrophica]
MNNSQFKRTLISLSLLAAVSTPAFAEHYDDYARVRSATPEYERVNTPRQECTNEYIPGADRRYQRSSSDRNPSYVGPLLGGVTGALIGSQIGQGRGNTAATAVAAIAGTVIGGNMQNNRRHDNDEYDDDRYRGREVSRCRTVDNWENRLTGYRVEYEYAGRTYTTVMPDEPGRKLPVRVSVVPAVGDFARNGSKW